MITRTSLKDLVRAGHLYFSDGYRTKRSELADSGYRILRVADVQDGSISLSGPDFVDPAYSQAIGEKAARPGDILLTTKGTIGRIAVTPPLIQQRVVYSPQLCFFRVSKSGTITPQFLKFWLKSPEARGQMGVYGGNTDMAPYLNLKDIGGMEITLPPLEEQERIGEVLGALDDKIAANRRVVDVSTALAVAQVEAVGETVPLRDLSTETRRSVPPARMGEGPVWHYSLPAFDAGYANLEDPSSIKSGKLKLDQSCVLVSKLNPRIPRIWHIAKLPQDYASYASTEFVVLSPVEGVSVGALWAGLIQGVFTDGVLARVQGTTGSHQRIRPADMLDVPVPDIRQLSTETSRLLSLLVSQSEQLVEENQRLAATRDKLLPLLMSGKITVKDAEKRVEEEV